MIRILLTTSVMLASSVSLAGALGGTVFNTNPGGSAAKITTMSGTAVTCASGAGVSTLTLNPTCTAPGAIVIVPIVNSDVDGCTVTMAESAAQLGCMTVLSLKSSAGGVVTVAAVGNVFVPDGSWLPAVNDNLVMTYEDLANPAWVEFSRHTTNSILTTAGVLSSAQVVGPDGSNAIPGITLTTQKNMGIFRVASNRLGISAGSRTDYDIDSGNARTITPDQLWFDGVATDITTSTNEDLTIAPNGTGQFVVTGGTKFTLNGDIGHTVAPTSVTSGSCTAETLASGGDELHGIITATCTAQTWIVLFTTTYGRAPTCVVTAINAASAADVGTVYATTTASLTATITTATTAGQWSYICME